MPLCGQTPDILGTAGGGNLTIFNENRLTEGAVFIHGNDVSADKGQIIHFFSPPFVDYATVISHWW